MKKIFTYLLAGLSLLSFSRCDSLDIEPTSSLAGSISKESHLEKTRTNSLRSIQDCMLYFAKKVIISSYWVNLVQTFTETILLVAKQAKAWNVYLSIP